MNFLILSLTDDRYHQLYHQRNIQFLFPKLPSSAGYWTAHSSLLIFEDKTPEELMEQTRALLLMLLSISSDVPRYLQPFREFLPLQNIYLLLTAFEVPTDHLQILNGAKAFDALLVSGYDIKIIKKWDNFLRMNLFIDYFRNMISTVNLPNESTN